MPWDGVDTFCLEVLDFTSSGLPVEPAKRGSRRVVRTATQAAGRRGLCGSWSPPGAKPCVKGPAARPSLAPVPIAWQRMLWCLPVSVPAQVLHSQVLVLFPKEEQCRWVPSAAQELHSHSCQDLEEQRRYWLSGQSAGAKGWPCPWQSLCCSSSLSLWGDSSDPCIAAWAAHPSASVCSLPPGQRHIAASQWLCLWSEGPTSWSLSHDGGLPEKEGKELSPAEPASGRSRQLLLLCLSRFQRLGGAEGKGTGQKTARLAGAVPRLALCLCLRPCELGGEKPTSW